MKDIGIYTSVAISLLGVAYPILLQVISTLDEKYSSIQIVELFDTEIEKKLFQYFLIGSLVSVFIWSLKLPPLISVDQFKFIIDNSAGLLLISSSVLLVTVFFGLVRKISIYLIPAKFIKYLIKHHNANKGEFKYFRALSDVFLQSIQKQNHNISQTISTFFYEDYKNQREKFKNQPVEYPDAYYTLVYKAIEELAIIKDKRTQLSSTGRLEVSGYLVNLRAMRSRKKLMHGSGIICF